MGFKDLKVLKEKKLYLVLIIWMLVGFTLYQFDFIPWELGAVIFLPLIVICILFLVIAVTSRKDINEIPKKFIILRMIISILFIAILFFIIQALFILAIISYVIITAVFTTYSFYKLGLGLEEKFPKANFFRFGLLLGGAIVSIIMLLVFAQIIHNVSEFNPTMIAVILCLIIGFFTIIAIILSARGKETQAWLGIFFLWVAIYCVYLMYSAYSALGDSDTTYSTPIQIALFFFNLFLVLNTIGGLLGEKADIIGEKIKIFGADTIIIWLIMAVASYEFAKGMPDMNITLFKTIVVFVLFIPLVFLSGLYGMKNYEKKL